MWKTFSVASKNFITFTRNQTSPSYSKQMDHLLVMNGGRLIQGKGSKYVISLWDFILNGYNLEKIWVFIFRFTYCAICCLSLLKNLDKINVQKAVEFVASCKNFDGGFGCTPGGESHAGQSKWYWCHVYKISQQLFCPVFDYFIQHLLLAVNCNSVFISPNALGQPQKENKKGWIFYIIKKEINCPYNYLNCTDK